MNESELLFRIDMQRQEIERVSGELERIKVLLSQVLDSVERDKSHGEYQAPVLDTLLPRIESALEPPNPGTLR